MRNYETEWERRVGGGHRTEARYTQSGGRAQVGGQVHRVTHLFISYLLPHYSAEINFLQTSLISKESLLGYEYPCHHSTCRDL